MSKKFKQLLVPEGYRHYWSKYPEGYTILEALLNWVDSVNQLTENVNDWNIYLDDFVENFDEELRSTVREMLNEMETDGRLAEIINDRIFSQKADITYVDAELDKKSDKINAINTQLAKKATKDHLGEVNQDLQSTKDTINDIITTPAEAISEQEIIDARKGESTLGNKIEKIDTNIEETQKNVFDYYFRTGLDFPEKHGGWISGYTTNETRGDFYIGVDHININFTNSGGVGAYGITTGERIDVTNISTLYIDWELADSGNGTRITFGLHKDRLAHYSVFDEQVTIFDTLPRSIAALDVSDLTGEYRLMIQPYTTATNSRAEVNVYRVYSDNKLLNVDSLKPINRDISHLQSLPTQQVYFLAGTQPYLEKSDSALYFKLENGAILFREGLYSYQLTQEIMIESVGEEYVGTSPQGVDDCIILQQAGNLVVDLTDSSQRIKAIHRSEYNIKDHLLILATIGGEIVDGLLVDNIQNYQINQLRRGTQNENATNLDSVYYSNLMDSGDNDFRMLYITDTHAEKSTYENGLDYLSNVKYLEQYGTSDLVVHGGDIINGALSDKKEALRNLSQLGRALNGETPHVLLFGNHDDNSYYNTSDVTPDIKISNAEWNKFVFSQFKDDIVTDDSNPHARYFYKDYPNKKIRVIGLDSIDIPEIITSENNYKWHGANAWGISVKQINWLGNVALAVPDSDWHVVLVSHIDPNNLLYNGDHVVNVLDNFIDGTPYNTTVTNSEWSGTIDVSFNNDTGHVAGVFCGHAHADKMIESVKGVRYVSILHAQSATNGAFDIINVNKDTRKVTLTRYADGDSERSFIY